MKRFLSFNTFLVLGMLAWGSAQAAPTMTTTPPTGSTLDFGDVTVSGSASLNVTVKNTGTGNLNGITADLLNDTVFEITSNNCSTLAAAAECTIGLTFSPLSAGMSTDTLTVSSTNDGSSTITLEGTGVDEAVASVSPLSLDFGDVAVGVTSVAQTVTVENTGTEDLLIDSVDITGTELLDFGLTNNCSATLAPSASCTIDVTYTPPDAGASTASLDLAFGNGAVPSLQIPLSGEGVLVPAISLNPLSLDFGTEFLSTDPSLTVTVTNDGAADLNVSAIDIGGADAAQFSVDSETCTGQAVAPGSSCEITVLLDPSTTGVFLASLDITSDALTSVDSVPLTATVIADAPEAILNPLTVNFGNVTVGTTSGEQDITLTNSGTADLNITSITASAGFSQTNDCGSVVIAGDFCTISVTFSPNSTGAVVGSLTVVDDASGSPHVVTLNGTGVGPGAIVSVAPSSLLFGNLVVGSTSQPQTVTVTNTGTEALVISTVTIVGLDAGEYDIINNNCNGATVQIGNTCSFQVVFAPTQVGLSNEAVVQVNSNAVASDNVALSGTGVAIGGPVVSVNPNPVVFGDVNINASRVIQVEVTNTGSVDLVIGQVSVSGVNAARFEVQVIGDTCSNSTVAPGATCKFNAKFSPNAVGLSSAEIVIPSNASTSPDLIPLTGIGVTPGNSGGCSIALSGPIAGSGMFLGWLVASLGGLALIRRRS